MSTTLTTAYRGSASPAIPTVPGGPSGKRQASRLKQWSARHPAWPVTALLVGYPVWWALGLADESVIILAIPMLLRMNSWRRQGRAIRVPPAFGVWLLFLLCMVAGIATLNFPAPDTVVSPLSNRTISFADRGLTYLALTVILLYAGNLAEKELSRRRLAWQLGLVGIYATIGGLGGVVARGFQFTSPLAYVLPASVQANTLIYSAMHPAFSQVTNVLGLAEGRPKAPFAYTNTWGNCLTILLPWLFVVWWSYGSRRQRKLAVITVAAALVPLVYSLNRGVWIGVGLTVAYLAVRLAARGKLAVLGVVCASLVIIGIVIISTPLQGIITSRLEHQQSNAIRASLSVVAIKDANAAPLIGFGDTRHEQGSASSIAVGPTSNCKLCGQYVIGSNGQLYMLLICTGWLGTGLYFAFFAFLVWRYRRDKTPYGMAGLLVIGLSFFYMFTYVSVTAPLEFTMLAVALLWRNDQWTRDARTVHDSPDLPDRPARGYVRHGTWKNWTPAVAGARSSTGQRPIIGPPRRQRADGRLAEVARGGLLNLIGAGVAGLSTVAVTLVVTRSFSVAVAGAFFTATSLFLIIEAIAGLGAAPGTVYFIARLRSMGQHHRIPEVIRSAMWPVIVVSAVAAVALALAAAPVARLLVHGQFGHAGAGPSEVAAALRALAVTLPFAALLDTLLGASRGFRAMSPTNVVDRIGRSLLQLAGIALVAAAADTALLAPLWALPYVPAACAAWLWLRHIQRRSRSATAELKNPGPADLRRWEHAAAADRGEPLRFWRFTAPRGLAALAQITIQRIDIVLVAIMRGPAEAAVYTAATRLLVAGQFGNQAISMAAQPRFTELFARGDHRGANSIYQVTTAWLILLTWPLYLLAICYGPQILGVFGHAYQAGTAVMIILALTMLLATGCGQVDTVLVTTGRSSWSLINGLLAVVVNVGLDVLLIPRYGIIGAAIGWSAAIIVTNLIPLSQLAIVMRLHPFGRGTFITAGLCALSFGVLPLAARGLFGQHVLSSLATIACGCAVMAAGMWRFRIDLNLAAMPGTAQLMAAIRRRQGPGRKLQET
jgi:O-antigen/teichoic acid export membrane protein